MPPPLSESDPSLVPMVIDDSDKQDDAEPELYSPGELPRPRFVMLGQQGVGRVLLPPTLKITVGLI